jgi:hypothetical protein
VAGQRPRKHHHPTAEQLDERIVLPLPPEVAIEAIMAAGPHPDEDDSSDEKKAPTK